MNDSVFTIIHDLKNPVNNVKLSIYLLEEELEQMPGKRLRKLLGMLRTSCRDAELLIQQLMEAAVIEDRPPLARLRPTDMGEYLRSVSEHYSDLAALQGVTFHWHPPEMALLAWVDTASFSRVIHNLFENALKFTQSSESIQLAVERQDGVVQITVEDSGVGIPAAAIPVLFDKFTPASRPGLHGEKSHGLGLFIVKQLVALNLGSIEVYSEVGEGTRFVIRLPRLEEVQLPPEDPLQGMWGG